VPKFLETKLKKQYGKDSDIPYKIMNKLGFMKGPNETSKGKAAEVKHKSSLDSKSKAHIVHKFMNKGN